MLRHPSAVEDIAINPDGTRLATSTTTGNARLWSLQSGERLGPPFSHDDRIFEISFDPTGEILATGSLDGTTKLWTLPTPMPGEGSPAEFVEAVTGMRMDEDGVLSWLDAAELRERRARLEEAGGE